MQVPIRFFFFQRGSPDGRTGAGCQPVIQSHQPVSVTIHSIRGEHPAAQHCGKHVKYPAEFDKLRAAIQY